MSEADEQGKRWADLQAADGERTCRYPAGWPGNGQGGSKKMESVIEKMRRDGYPYIIKGNDGYTAVLCDMQPLFDGEYMAIYRYPGGECCHDLLEIQRHFEIIEQ